MTTAPHERYNSALRRVLRLTHEAYIATSTPAPHPVRWKRWFRRPYRKVNHVAFMEYMHRHGKARL